MTQNYCLQSSWKDAGKNYEWMLNQREEFDEDQRIYIVSKYLLTNNLLQKEKC